MRLPTWENGTIRDNTRANTHKNQSVSKLLLCVCVCVCVSIAFR